jgi:hypothetical protein
MKPAQYSQKEKTFELIFLDAWKNFWIDIFGCFFVLPFFRTNPLRCSRKARYQLSYDKSQLSFATSSSYDGYGKMFQKVFFHLLGFSQ